jgi:hypothetical protein
MPVLELVHTDPSTPVQPPAGALSNAEAEAAARAMVRLFARWNLTDTEAATLLGGVAPRTWARWKKGELPKLGRDLRARMSNLLGIHKALRTIFSDAERGYGWVKRSNEAFGGQSALEIMLNGELTDLMRIRSYLDTERGGW